MQESSRQRFDVFRKQFRVGTLPPELEDDGLAAEKAAETRDKKSASAAKLRYYWQWLSPYKRQIALVFGLALTAAMLGLVPPYATKLIIDRVLQAKDGSLVAWGGKWRALHLAGGAVLLLILVQQAIEANRNYLVNLLNLRVLRRLQQRLFEHMIRLPLHILHKMKTGGIATRLSNDVDDVSGLVQMALITPGVAAFRVLATLLILVAIQWEMALVAIGILLPIVAINALWIRKLKPLHRSIRKDRGEVNARTVETFGGIPVVRVFGRERKEARDFATGQNLVVRKRLLTRLYYLAISTAWGTLVPLSSLLIIWYGGTQYLMKSLTIGEIVAFQMYVFQLMMPISQIVQSWSNTQLALAALDRTVDILQQSVDKPDRPDAVPAPSGPAAVTFDNVTFGYDPEAPVLKDIDLHVEGGQTVALVGRSGAGKSTLTNLVARFYDPDRGAIRLGGIDLRDIQLESYRSLLGMVQQDVFLFDGTIRENIAYGRRGAPLEAIIGASRRANAHEFIEALPEGYDTLIGERGIRLSGGQKQRVSIARAILADPRILILDEATSNLDSESEQLIQASLVELLAGRTTFVIAHRLSTVTRADLIVVLDAGRVIETGNHQELVTANGVYREMLDRQSRLRASQLEAASEGLDWS